jgi:lysophospholipase L1-like esterase
MQQFKRINIYLAADSIVQDYREEEFIGGWGQYLPYFFDKEKVSVNNKAKGGRSSRFFINEGRFDEFKAKIEKGDYLFIQFGHNDDASKPYTTMYNRLLELGKPDENGKYPLIEGKKISTEILPKEYIEALNADATITDKQAVINEKLGELRSYGKEYYPYSKDGSMGTYKWFLKQYVDHARSVSATPVLVTSPARASFNEDGSLKDGPGLHGGDNFSYIRAVRQLAEEENVLLIDLFKESKKIFEGLGKGYSHYLTSIKEGVKEGIWPKDFNRVVGTEGNISEDTHFNKFGAFLFSAKVAEAINDAIDMKVHTSSGESFESLKQVIYREPIKNVVYPEKLEPKMNDIKKFFKCDIL